MSVRTAPGVALALAAVAAAQAGEWPQFRGPTGQGHAPDEAVPLTWSETDNVAWKTPVPGRGWSSPVIADGMVWLTTAVTDRETGTSLRLLSYDAESGDAVGDVEVFGIADTTLMNQKNSFASPTPVIDSGGERLFVHFGSQGTAAVNPDGEVLWQTRFPYTSQHGNGGSPILHEGLLIVSIDGYDTAFLVAVDAETGEERWRSVRPAPISQAYSTPLAIELANTEQIVNVSAFRASAHEPATGNEIWRVEYPGGFSNVSRPVYGHGLVYLSTGFNEPVLLAVRPTGKGDVTESEVAWRLRRGAPLTVSPILVGDELFTVTDSGIATCIDALTGEIRWQHRLGGNHSASPIHAGGRIYFQNEEGVTTVIAPGPRFEQLARNELDGSTLASIAVADGAFFIRTGRHLYRIEESR
ncbi:MAG: PQQ-binding-like beta-propeller repeat protein [Holophagales bacterium]|nr:PQQ-binding-like beta-propeller repeat protein [Holophagales bacterium]MYG31835.1 PQQ-binding-like beta-propeller repeat protein [Holophagales bacterium]MYI79677.1 PQQ-binding-like beta-propeller repeat protein [Holophagales bacterium]